MALVAILNSMMLLFFYQPVQNNDTKRVNDIIVCNFLLCMDLHSHYIYSQSAPMHFPICMSLCVLVYMN